MLFWNGSFFNYVLVVALINSSRQENVVRWNPFRILVNPLWRSTWIKKALLPCYSPRCQQVSHQGWFWGIRCTQVTKHRSSGTDFEPQKSKTGVSVAPPRALMSSKILSFFILVTARKRSLGQDNMFTGVCLSTGGMCYPSMHCRWYPSMQVSGGSQGPHPRGSGGGSGVGPQPRGKLRGSGLGRPASEGAWPQGVPGRGVPALEGVPGPVGCLLLGGTCSRGGVVWWRLPWTATAAGGTHPTGMHSWLKHVVQFCVIFDFDQFGEFEFTFKTEKLKCRLRFSV